MGGVHDGLLEGWVNLVSRACQTRPCTWISSCGWHTAHSALIIQNAPIPLSPPPPGFVKDAAPFHPSPGEWFRAGSVSVSVVGNTASL